jgi:cell division protein FtsL
VALTAIAIATVLFALLQVNQFSRLTSTGYEIEELKRERTVKQAANHELEAEVAALSSLARIDWEARTRLGLQPAARTLYIEVNADAPAQQSLPTRYRRDEPAPVTGPAEDGGAPLWRRMLRLLPF